MLPSLAAWLVSQCLVSQCLVSQDLVREVVLARRHGARGQKSR